MGWKSAALSTVRRLGGFRLVGSWYGRRRLTVLAYHRVIDLDSPDFVGFRGNVSAAPREFETQMEWIAERMNPVSIEQVARSLDGGRLPDRPVLVTFDDGYRDNLDHALPVLERLAIPATVFLATDHVGSAVPFWWDLVAWRFATSGVRQASLPLLGETEWSDSHEIARRWIVAAKQLLETAKVEAVAALSDQLGGTDPAAAFGSTLVDWAGVRRMSGSGVLFGAHTCSHPILTRIDTDQVVGEVSQSVARIREEVGSPVLGFAYPNGQRGDFDDVAQRAVSSAGVPLAFSLVPGPARPSEIRKDPLAIRRVYVHHGDGMERFVAKVAGIPRLTGRS